MQDLFAGTGVNPKAYALMDQERLNHVLTAKPWERRMFIEEAAGIARYKQQRSETQGKLDATRLEPPASARRHGGGAAAARPPSSARPGRPSSTRRCRRSGRGSTWPWSPPTTRRSPRQHETVTREMESLRETEEQQRARVATLTGRQALQAAAIQDTEYRLGDLRQSVQKIQGEAERLLERREQMGVQIQDLLGRGDRASRRRSAGSPSGGSPSSAERDDKSRALDEVAAAARPAGRGGPAGRGPDRGLPVRARASAGSASRPCASSRSGWRAPAPI